MADATLTILIGFAQLLLGAMGVYVSLRPPDPKRHWQWIGGFIFVGLAGVGMTGWLSLRAARIQAELQTQATTAAQDVRSARAEIESLRRDASLESARRQQAEKDLAMIVEKSGRSTRMGVAEDIRKAPITLEVSGRSVQLSPEERQKRKTIRDRLGSFLSETTAIKQFCLTDPQPGQFSCEDEATKWFQRTTQFIDGNLEPSYSARFLAATGLSLSYDRAKTPEINNWINFLTFKASALEGFIKEFRD